MTFVCAIELAGGVRDGQRGRCKEECAHCRRRRTGERSGSPGPMCDRDVVLVVVHSHGERHYYRKKDRG